MHRPIGVTVIAIVVLINGIVVLIGGIASLFVTLAFVAGLITLLFGFALLYLAWGLWTLQFWAWLATLIIEGLNALFALIALLAAPNAISAWITIVLAAIVIYYLMLPNIRDAFRRRTAI